MFKEFKGINTFHLSSSFILLSSLLLPVRQNLAILLLLVILHAVVLLDVELRGVDPLGGAAPGGALQQQEGGEGEEPRHQGHPGHGPRLVTWSLVI